MYICHFGLCEKSLHVKWKSREFKRKAQIVGESNRDGKVSNKMADVLYTVRFLPFSNVRFYQFLFLERISRDFTSRDVPMGARRPPPNVVKYARELATVLSVTFNVFLVTVVGQMVKRPPPQRKVSRHITVHQHPPTGS